MPKREDKHSMAEDYLAQMNWEADQSRDPNRGIPPVRFEPKWKYKPSGPTRSPMSPTSRIILTTVLLIFLGGLLYLAIVKHEAGAISLIGALVFIGVLVLVLILDASKPKRLK